MDHVLLLDLLL